MIMCSKCHKRVAVVFVTKLENGEKVSNGLCVKCAREMGLPVDNMLGDIYNKMGITADQLEDMEDEIAGVIGDGYDKDGDDTEDGGAPAIDLPKLFKDSGLFPKENPDSPDGGSNIGKGGIIPTERNDRNRRQKDKRNDTLAFRRKCARYICNALRQYVYT